MNFSQFIRHGNSFQNSIPVSAHASQLEVSSPIFIKPQTLVYTQILVQSLCVRRSKPAVLKHIIHTSILAEVATFQAVQSSSPPGVCALVQSHPHSQEDAMWQYDFPDQLVEDTTTSPCPPFDCSPWETSSHVMRSAKQPVRAPKGKNRGLLPTMLVSQSFKWLLQPQPNPLLIWPPPDILTPISWKTLSQNHPAKPLLFLIHISWKMLNIHWCFKP